MAHWCIGHVMVMTFVALRAFFGSPVFVCSFVEVFLASLVLGCYVKLLFTGIEWDAIATATTHLKARRFVIHFMPRATALNTLHRQLWQLQKQHWPRRGHISDGRGKGKWHLTLLS